MKILWMTDSHFKLRGSMSKESNNTKYSTRLDSLINTYKYAYQLAEQQGCDIVINGGDLLDKPIISAEESHAIREAFSNITIPTYVLVGNHDMKSSNCNILAVLDNVSNVTVVDKPMKLNDSVSLMPFTNDYTIDSVYSLSSKILFSHVDILGIHFSQNVVSNVGFDPLVLSQMFKLVINGHIHTASRVNDVVYNSGAVTGSGLGDNYSEAYPGFLVIDTDTLQMTRFDNPYALLYFKINVNSLADLSDQMNNILRLASSRQLYIKIVSPSGIADECRNYLNTIQSQWSNVINTMVSTVSVVKDTSSTMTEKLVDFSNDDPVQVLIDYTNSIPDKKLPYSRNEMNDFLSKEIGSLGGNTNE